MSKKGYILSEHDKRVLKALLYKSAHLRINYPSRGDAESQDQPTPEVYVARPYSDPIPPLVPGTFDSPGGALCTIYRMVNEDDTPILVELETTTKVVYNLSETEVEGWILVIRDKFGQWWAVTAIGGGTTPGTGTGTSPTDPCLEAVTDVVCNGDGTITLTYDTFKRCIE